MNKPVVALDPLKEVAANIKLMREMGSENGYDPIPPSNYLYFSDSEDEIQRVLCFVREHTIRKGCRSPFAVMKAGGRPLTKADLAREKFGGNKGNAWRAWDKAAATGLVFENEEGFLCLGGNVKAPAKKGLKKGRRNGESKLSLETILSPDLIETIDSFPEANRNRCKAAFVACEEWRLKIAADAATLVQIGPDRVHDNIRRTFGLPVKRLSKKHRKDLHEKGSQYLQLKLVLVPRELELFDDLPASSKVSRDNENPVSGDNFESVARQPAEAPEKASVKAPEGLDASVPLKTQREKPRGEVSAPLSVFKEPPITTTTKKPSPDSVKDDVVVVVHRLGITEDAAHRFLAECRRKSEGCTVAEIVAVIDRMEPTVDRLRYPNVTGVLLKAVPPKIAAYRREVVDRAAHQRPQGPGPWEATPENLRVVLHRWAAQLRPDFEPIADALERAAKKEDLANIEAMEALLKKLDAELMAAAEIKLTDGQRRELAKVDPETKKMLAKMTKEQGAALLKQRKEKRLCELCRLPMLSIFSASDVAQGASGDD